MRALVLLAAFVLATADTDVRAVRHGTDVVISDGEAIATALVALVESCSVSSTTYAVSPDTWKSNTTSDSFVLATFRKPRSVRLVVDAGGTIATRPIDAILLPLPERAWPAHIYVKIGDDVHACTKYSPEALAPLVAEPDLGLRSNARYAALLHSRDE